MLLNLASVANAADAAVLWGFIARYAPGTTPRARRGWGPGRARHRLLPRLRGADPQLPRPEHAGAGGTRGAARWLGAAGEDADAEAIQYELYEIGKRHAFANLRDWFKALYEVLLGQSEGPRFGTFVAIYGTAETRAPDRERPRREAEAA